MPDYYLSVVLFFFKNISTLKGILITLKGWELLVWFNRKVLKLQFSDSCALYFKLDPSFRSLTLSLYM